MAKYNCVCGSEFKKKDESRQHIDLFENDPHAYHFIYEKGIWSRFLDLDITFFLATIGGLIVNGVIANHLNFSITESIIEGLSFGFLLGRIVCYEK